MPENIQLKHPGSNSSEVRPTLYALQLSRRRADFGTEIRHRRTNRQDVHTMPYVALHKKSLKHNRGLLWDIKVSLLFRTPIKYDIPSRYGFQNLSPFPRHSSNYTPQPAFIFQVPILMLTFHSSVVPKDPSKFETYVTFCTMLYL